MNITLPVCFAKMKPKFNLYIIFILPSLLHKAIYPCIILKIQVLFSAVDSEVHGVLHNNNYEKNVDLYSTPV